MAERQEHAPAGRAGYHHGRSGSRRAASRAVPTGMAARDDNLPNIGRFGYDTLCAGVGEFDSTRPRLTYEVLAAEGG
jgi:hypothetical protein